MAIDYSRLLTMQQPEALEYLRESYGSIGPITQTFGGSDVDPAQYAAPGYETGMLGYLQPTVRSMYGGGEGDYTIPTGLYEANITGSFDPEYAGGVYGHYVGTFDSEGNLRDVRFQKDERHGGWFSENLDWIGPLVVGGAMLGGSGVLSGMGSSGAAASSGGISPGVMAGLETAVPGAGLTPGVTTAGAEALIGGTATDMLATTVPQGLGTGTFGMNSAWTTPALAAMEAGTLPALTTTGATTLGATLPSVAAVGATAAGSTLPAWLTALGNKAVDWATSPKTLLSAGLTLADMASRDDAPSGGGSGVAASPDNRGRVQWDWNRINQAAQDAGLNLNQFVARNFGRLQSGEFNQPSVNMAQGGALNTVARLARGGGSGRADTIPARLSDGEFVVDAETVALLGDGSTQAGAEQLERMRHAVRQHKGRALARGKFSPDAKSPLAYMMTKGGR